MWKVSRGGTHLVHLAIGTVPDDFNELENPRRVLKFRKKSLKSRDECGKDESHTQIQWVCLHYELTYFVWYVIMVFACIQANQLFEIEKNYL